MTFKRLLHKIKMGPKWFYSNMSYIVKWNVMRIAKNSVLNAYSPKITPWLWKQTGVNIKGSIKIGFDVYYDVGYANLITIEDGVWIASRSLLFCHKRILTDYCIGDDYNSLPYQKKEIVLKKGCCVGMGAIILPGVTIGEGAIIGAGSVVTTSIPAWTIVVGNPAKVVREIQIRENPQI